MNNPVFYGTGVALVTPFKKNLSVDHAALENIVKHTLNNGADFLVALGTTSEAPVLTQDEKQSVVKTIVKTCGERAPIMLGMGGNNTASVVAQIKEQDFQGISGILSVVPYYNKPQQGGIIAHFNAIATASPVPVVLYNVPGRTALNMTAQSCLELAQHPNIIAVKEASGDLQQIMTILKDKPADFSVLSGDDALTMPLIALGADGVISVAANAYTADFSQMVKLQRAGKTHEARILHYKMLEMTTLLFEDGNPAGVKALLNLMGLCEDQLRLPLLSMRPALKQKMKIIFDQNQIH
ncbi:MAG: 4-hydroxy-tetrahydrodipicolinate synthase [Bacteroidetes bacterium]|nr:4-hydroxy-tetrahydrodipicolinate synthase [Bacteroidota bacterium]MBU1580704.1 4-hydroxy-tetrahydrodipicolinate synthase [Bacteroidota bacterium]MBU2466344.1 4-hydroxy-tetrahydrodipicolinate synthase [Bacteroidota bacterium]MBU2558112.1 4-hydroxy-tetrahydrodipicolinate synthase [Bacteroidota bacterium]